MDAREVIPSPHVHSHDFKGRDVTYTVKSMGRIKFTRDNMADDVKGLMAVEETEKLIVLNKTNLETIWRMLAEPNTTKWIGKRITFYPAKHKDTLTGEMGTAIRVRGSPDISGPASFTFRIGRGVKTFNVIKTPDPKSTATLTGDELAAEVDAIRVLFGTVSTPDAMKTMWREQRLNERMKRFPELVRNELTAEAKAKTGVA